MTKSAPRFLTVDEFLIWAQGQPGRYELEAGEVVAMAPERIRHAEVKAAVWSALRDAIRAGGLPCRALPDGVTVRLSDQTAYEPDALVYCGPRLPPDAIEASDPVIVVEVVSPSSGANDTGARLAGYFTVPSLRHYLIVDPVRVLVIHHARADAARIDTRILRPGETLRLDPPGLVLDVAEMLTEA